MKNKRLALLPITGAALGGGLLAYLVVGHGVEHIQAAPPGTIASITPRTPDCGFDIRSVSGFQRIKPLLSTGPACESAQLAGLRTGIGTLVDEIRTGGHVNSVSVYVHDLEQNDWITYNGSEAYAPGSMLKVPLMMYFLSMAERDPSLLKETWTCEAVDLTPQHSEFPSTQAELNTTYTVDQVLELAIANSDNLATAMILRHVSLEGYARFFVDLGLPKPDRLAKDYLMTVKDYSIIIKALYNSSLLSPMASERALGIMTRSSFKAGLVAGLPPDLEVAHKFGEAGNEAMKELHETGLVYADGHPYLITVMTRGDQMAPLAEAIASISRLVYERMTAG
jgi:beta-lactamase class A